MDELFLLIDLQFGKYRCPPVPGQEAETDGEVLVFQFHQQRREVVDFHLLQRCLERGEILRLDESVDLWLDGF